MGGRGGRRIRQCRERKIGECGREDKGWGAGGEEDKTVQGKEGRGMWEGG